MCEQGCLALWRMGEQPQVGRPHLGSNYRVTLFAPETQAQPHVLPRLCAVCICRASSSRQRISS
jgi:hypothetical protein